MLVPTTIVVRILMMNNVILNKRVNILPRLENRRMQKKTFVADVSESTTYYTVVVALLSEVRLRKSTRVKIRKYQV